MPALSFAAREPTWVTPQPLLLEPVYTSALDRPSATQALSIAARQATTSTSTTATTATSSPINSAIEKPSPEVIGGVIVGSVTALVLIVVIYCCCYRRRGRWKRSGTSSIASWGSRHPLRNKSSNLYSKRPSSARPPSRRASGSWRRPAPPPHRPSTAQEKHAHYHHTPPLPRPPARVALVNDVVAIVRKAEVRRSDRHRHTKEVKEASIHKMNVKGGLPGTYF